MNWQLNIQIYNDTLQTANQFNQPQIFKHVFNPRSECILCALNPTTNNANLIDNTKIIVKSCDCLELAKECPEKPLVLVYADDRFAGGAVLMGSGAQEESIFRRTNVCTVMNQSYYPIRDNEYILVKNVTVFKNNLGELIDPYLCDLIFVPGIRELDDMNDPKIQILENKIRSIFEQKYNYYILGALGCGAWKSNPIIVANVFKKVINELKPSKEIYFSILENIHKDYIVKLHNKADNYKIFKEILGE